MTTPVSSKPEVLVIGGGVMGCGIALRLAQAGAGVTVLERAIPGAEASSAAAGILAPQKEATGPGPFLELCLRSRGLYPDFARELEELSGVSIGYRPCGVLQVAFDADEALRLKSTVAWQHDSGLRAELLTPSDARAGAGARAGRGGRRVLSGRPPGGQPPARPRALHGRGTRGRALPHRLRAWAS